jgi:hypothetical protein
MYMTGCWERGGISLFFLGLSHKHTHAKVLKLVWANEDLIFDFAPTTVYFSYLR